VLDGFFPKCGLREQTQTEQTGFQEFGLPYASDPAITKHLAQFLWEHRFVGRNEGEVESLSDCMAARPDWILFNGGVMTSAPICDRIVSVVASWFANQDGISADWMPQVLDGERLDLAVAKGAAYFGQVRRGTGVQIEATLACSYYLQTSVEPPLAICIVPGSASAGDQFRLSNKPFELTIGQPVQFPIVYSTTRLADKLGEVVEIDREHFAFLPPIRTVIELSGRRRQESLPVVIEVELTQIGTLQIYCQASDTEHRWKLEFDVRGSTQSGFSADRVSANPAPILDETLADTARKILSAVFREGTLKPSRLMGTLADEMGIRKNHWPPSLLRAMWSALIDWESGRRKSAEHEARWLNLLGYSLRPGYGLAADDWRVAQTWRLIHGKLAFASVSSRNESLILWRRISGGFTAGQQLTVYQQIAGPLRAAIDPERRAKGGGGTQQTELVELLRLVGSLELLPSREKLQIGAWLLELLQSKKWSPMHAACLWTIGRLGSRQPTYGPLNSVIEVREVSLWLEKLLRLPNDDSNYALALMLCGRRVGDRYRDIEATLREEVESGLARASAPEHYRVLVGQGGELEGEEASQILGESLPLGLTTMR
jgi:hypothetical protein